MRIAQRVISVDRYGELASNRGGGIQVEAGVEAGGGFRGAISAHGDDDVAGGIGSVHLASQGVQRPALDPVAAGGDQYSVLIDLEIPRTCQKSAGRVGSGGHGRAGGGGANDEETV